MADDSNVKVVDLGYKRIIAEMKLLGDIGITCGIHEDVAPHDNGISVAEIYSVHEFGTRDGRVPERSTLRPAFDDHVDEDVRAMAGIMERVQDGSNPLLEMQRLALVQEARVKKNITDIKSPPLKPATIAGRQNGGDNPLVDTARMRNSVQARVVNLKTNPVTED